MIVVDLAMLTKQCAPNVAYNTMVAIVNTESHKNPLAIGINGKQRLAYSAQTLNQAIAWVDYLESNHYNFDVGLAQVNIRNIHSYGYRAHDMLDPCLNLHLSSIILAKSYSRAKITSHTHQEALKKAISSYNTGNYSSGLYNGYVAKVIHNAPTNNQQTLENYSSSLTIESAKTVIYSNPNLKNIQDVQYAKN